MIKATVLGSERVIENLRKAPSALEVELRKGVARAALLVLRQTVSNKLQGQVLNVRTGRLQRSINASPVTEEGGALVSRVGTNVIYGRLHEYGFQGSVSVRSYVRPSKSGATATVRAHQRKVTYPERSFLRTALADMQPQIRAEFEAATARASKAIAGG